MAQRIYKNMAPINVEDMDGDLEELVGNGLHLQVSDTAFKYSSIRSIEDSTTVEENTPPQTTLLMNTLTKAHVEPIGLDAQPADAQPAGAAPVLSRSRSQDDKSNDLAKLLAHASSASTSLAAERPSTKRPCPPPPPPPPPTAGQEPLPEFSKVAASEPPKPRAKSAATKPAATKPAAKPAAESKTKRTAKPAAKGKRQGRHDESDGASEDSEDSESEADSESDEQFHVKSILEHRYNGAKRQYLVEWDDDESPATWEPAKNVSDDLIKQYLNENPDARPQVRACPSLAPHGCTIIIPQHLPYDSRRSRRRRPRPYSRSR